MGSNPTLGTNHFNNLQATTQETWTTQRSDTPLGSSLFVEIITQNCLLRLRPSRHQSSLFKGDSSSSRGIPAKPEKSEKRYYLVPGTDACGIEEPEISRICKRTANYSQPCELYLGFIKSFFRELRLIFV